MLICYWSFGGQNARKMMINGHHNFLKPKWGLEMTCFVRTNSSKANTFSFLSWETKKTRKQSHLTKFTTREFWQFYERNTRNNYNNRCWFIPASWLIIAALTTGVVSTAHMPGKSDLWALSILRHTQYCIFIYLCYCLFSYVPLLGSDTCLGNLNWF